MNNILYLDHFRPEKERPVIIATFHFGLDAYYLIGCQLDMLEDQDWLDDFDEHEYDDSHTQWIGVILSDLQKDS